MPFEPTPSYAQHLDAQDELAHFRSHFYLLPNQIYLDGNSLGLLCIQAEQAVLRVLNEWKTLGIDGWMNAALPWFFMAEELAKQTAPLIGAESDEVIVANQTTVNLHQLIATLFQPTERRMKILADALAFPSDVYALQSQLRLRGLDPATHLVKAPSHDGLTLREEDIVAAMTDDVQIAVLPAVIFTSGQLLDIAALTEQAHQRNVLIGFDCSHSIGAVPHQLSAWGVDFAFWCNYKYLNNGPGGTGGLYLNRKHFNHMPGLAGWFSSDKAKQFDMSHDLQPAHGAGALQIGTPNVLSLAALQGSLALIAEAGIERIRQKSLDLTAYLMALIEAELSDENFSFANPRENHRHGGHVALVHAEAVRICKALKDAGVIPDYRRPNVIRLAPGALYSSFVDCFEVVQRLKKIMAGQTYRNYAAERGMVS